MLRQNGVGSPAAEARRLVERFEWHCTPSTVAGSIFDFEGDESRQPGGLEVDDDVDIFRRCVK
jgi:hypothetical protein